MRRWGFRTVLTVNALICAFFLGIYAVFTPATPHIVIAGVLLVGGFFRSLQFTALNAVAYADIPQASMSRATALAAVAQQLFSSAGVAFAALVLETSRAMRGDDQLVTQDFTTAFLAIAGLMAIAAFAHWRLAANAAANVSGHRAMNVPASL